VVIERDADAFYVGEVSQLRACYSQGRTIDALMENWRDVIALCLETEPEYTPTEFAGGPQVLNVPHVHVQWGAAGGSQGTEP